jgi:hypothetical protein
VSTGSYSIMASGENVWGADDAFYFVWKKFLRDAALTADIAFPTKTGNPHKSHADDSAIARCRFALCGR